MTISNTFHKAYKLTPLNDLSSKSANLKYLQMKVIAQKILYSPYLTDIDEDLDTFWDHKQILW